MVKAMIRDFYSIAKSIQITLHVRVDTNVTIIDDLIKLKHFFFIDICSFYDIMRRNNCLSVIY